MALHNRQQPAFTVVELLVVIGIIALLISVMLPTLCRSREQGNRVKCASNLRQIGMAIQMYANDNKGNFPRTYFDQSDNPVPTAFTGAKAADPFGPGGPAANDVSAAFYLLLRTQDLTAEVFVCPSSSAERSTASPKAASNFARAEELSYSYNNPYPSKAFLAALKAPFVQPRFPTSDYAMAADMNPGGMAVTTVKPDGRRQDLMAANSRNHNGDGQNVLYGDGHVEFQSTPFAGDVRKTVSPVIRDNVYVSGGPGTGVPATVFAAHADLLDSVLLPTSDPATMPSALVVAMNKREHGARRIVWIASAGVMLGACGFGGMAIHIRRKRRAGATRAPATP